MSPDGALLSRQFMKRYPPAGGLHMRPIRPLEYRLRFTALVRSVPCILSPVTRKRVFLYTKTPQFLGIVVLFSLKQETPAFIGGGTHSSLSFAQYLAVSSVYASMAVSSTIFTISVKLVWRSAAVVDSGANRWSLTVRMANACTWNCAAKRYSAAVSISTARIP